MELTEKNKDILPEKKKWEKPEIKILDNKKTMGGGPDSVEATTGQDPSIG